MSEQINQNNTSSVDIDNYVEVFPELVYLTIPAKYVCTYHKLLVLMANFGEDIINDCSVSCKGNGKYLISCWNMFQAACSAYQLGRIENADFFIKYIEEQISLTYKGVDLPACNDIFDVTISEDGQVKAVVTCGQMPRFFVDPENGELYKSLSDGRFYNENDDNIVIK